jgi:hypothetical protein
MSRLLHAAARGARIEGSRKEFDIWIAVSAVRLDNFYYDYRIHPDDEHLQYGPISTALRNHALGLPKVETSWFSKLLLHTDGDLQTLPPFDRYIFLLLVAEALADEGM